MIRSYHLKIVGLIAIFCCLAVFANISYGGGVVVKHQIESPSIAKNKVGISSNRLIQVYLPENYGVSDYHFPTFYWIGGYTDVSIYDYPKMLDEAIQSLSMPPVIVIFINVSEGIYFLNSDIFGYWEDFLINEVIPFIDGKYKTIPNENGRALGGHSAGGLDSIMLPLWHPNIWGAIGTNDAAVWIPWEYLIDKEEIELFEQGFKDVIINWGINARKRLFSTISKSNIADYNKIERDAKVIWQFAAKISPNSNKPNLVDIPMTEDGNWIPEIHNIWREFCILEPKTIESYKDELSSLSLTLTVVDKNMNTVGYENDYFVSLLKSAGISVNRLEMPGSHEDFKNERFIELAKAVLGGLNIVSVESKGKLPIAWGKIKSQI